MFRWPTHDEWRESVRIGVICGLSTSGGGLLLALVLGFAELRYACFGMTAEATIGETFLMENQDARPRGLPCEKVKYLNLKFIDQDHQFHQGFDHVPARSIARVGDQVEVQYVPGNDHAIRLAENKKPRALVFLGVCFAGLVMFVCAFWRRSARELADVSRVRKRR